MDGTAASDGVEVDAAIGGQRWRLSWWPPPDPPPGTPHGAAALCLAGDQVLLVSMDGEEWTLPGGRPEPGENAVDTLRREVREEACASVTSCRLLGFSRGECVDGHERGLVLVRSLWRAEVVLDAWRPQFEISHRRLVPAGEVLRTLRLPAGLVPLHRRILLEAGLTASTSDLSGRDAVT